MKYTMTKHELKTIMAAARIIDGSSARLHALYAAAGLTIKSIEMTNAFNITVIFPTTIRHYGDLTCVRTFEGRRVRALYKDLRHVRPYTVIDADGTIVSEHVVRPKGWPRGGRS